MFPDYIIILLIAAGAIRLFFKSSEDVASVLAGGGTLASLRKRGCLGALARAARNSVNRPGLGAALSPTTTQNQALNFSIHHNYLWISLAGKLPVNPHILQPQ